MGVKRVIVFRDFGKPYKQERICSTLMKYILDKHYRFRGYKKLPTGLLFFPARRTEFYTREQYDLLLDCDGVHEFEPDQLDQKECKFLKKMEEQGVIHPAEFWEMLLPEQVYRQYPAEYRENCHWSITGCCNFRCRHCFMSAPQAKHGAPTWEELIDIADQLAECGVFTVGITGGEPLIRGDFLPLMDELNKREIRVSTIYTNGWLVDEALLDALEERHIHPAFQLSFDGVGQHDFLRGFKGAEEQTIHALRLLQERNYYVSVSMSLHRGNAHTIRDTVRLLGSLGVRSMKIGEMMELGDWAQPDMKDLHLTLDETYKLYLDYIPEYFEDDAPVDIMLGGGFMYYKAQGKWSIYHVSRCPADIEGKVPSCGVLLHNFYISAEGRVAPCMGMDDCGYAVNFPNLFKQPLREILSDSEFTKLGCVTVKEVRDANPKCRSCEYIDRCTGGCRNSVLLEGDDYYGISTEMCEFFEHGWDQKTAEAAAPAYQAYLERHPELKKAAKNKSEPGSAPEFC